MHMAFDIAHAHSTHAEPSFGIIERAVTKHVRVVSSTGCRLLFCARLTFPPLVIYSAYCSSYQLPDIVASI